MNISRNDLYRIVLEEYVLAEGLQLEALGPKQVEEMLAWIRKQGPKPDWLGDDYGHSKKVRSGQVPADPNADRAAQTMPIGMDIPSDDAPESEYQGFQNDSGPDVEDQLAALIQGMDPESVAELFQTVFEKIPGVELSRPGDEDYPDEETLYSPGAEGRPTISLGPIREHLAAKAFEKILEIAGLSYGTHSISGVPGNRDEDEEVDEGHYHDMGGEDEAYDVLDPHGFAKMADAELIDMMRADGMEEIMVLDGDGDLANREEVIAALKDV